MMCNNIVTGRTLLFDPLQYLSEKMAILKIHGLNAKIRCSFISYTS